MFNITECTMNMNNIDKNDIYSNNVAANRSETMSFMGTLSPGGSSVDSSDIRSPEETCLPPAPMDMDITYNSALHMQNFVTGKPILKIIEEPVEKFRFRYKSEMAGTHGSLIGMNSDKIRKNTYPTVQLENYEGRAFIRCSIYQIKEDAPHAHRLVMKADLGEKDDPHDIEVSPERGYVAIFKSMGIIHTAKRYLAPELYKKLHQITHENFKREGIYRNLSQQEEADLKKVAENYSKNINLNKVRLKFEAYGYEGNSYLEPLCQPVYSQEINNLKSAMTGELKIVRLDHTTASCVGGQEIFIFVEKVTKNNIKVRFFECDEDDNEIWQDYGRFSPNDVHHQYAIAFKVPPYKDLNIEEPVNVCIQLVRPTDGAKSDPRTFKYKPSEKIGRKRVRYEESVSSADLPTTINCMSLSSVDSLPDTLIEFLNSDESFKDLGNMGSTEFKQIFEIVAPDFKNLTTDGCSSTPSTSASCSRTSARNDDLYVKICKKVVNDLASLLKTNPKPDRLEGVVKTLFKDLRAPEGNNAVHCAILREQTHYLRYMMLLLTKMKHLNILDIQNNKKQTALHLAVHVNDPTIVKLLLPVGANPNIPDINGNTPLNLVVKNQLNLTEYEKLVEQTDLEIDCDGGYTPLHSAVQKGNLNSVKLLVEKNADVNHAIPSTGNTVLHLAIEEKNKEIVEFLLEKTNARLDAENHSQVTPVHLAKLLFSEGPDSKKIFNIINDFIKNRGFESLMIKDEPDCDSSSDESEDINFEIKLEPNSPETVDVTDDDMITLKNSQFTKECIKELAEVLDGTEFLEKLSKDLNFEEIRSSLLTLNTSQLLNYAYVIGKNVFVVRELLKSYGAVEAVKIIDKIYLKK